MKPIEQMPISIKGFSLKLSDDASLTSSQRIELISKKLPELRKGQVLVKILASPVNPSDLVHLLGKYGLKAESGLFVGFEACGIVVQANAGLYGKYLVGKRVALSAQPGHDGLWAQYAITKANYCLPVTDAISDEQASTLIVNPCTSVCLVERAIALGAKAIVLNAAASQVGKGVIRYATSKGISTIASIRNKQHAEQLIELGATQVLVTGDENYQQNLQDACQKYQAEVLLDAVAAEDTARSLKAMPNGSTAIVYGRLTETHDPFGGIFPVADVIFRDIKIEGFWLAKYIGDASIWQVYRLSQKVQRLFTSGVFKTDIHKVVDFKDFAQALDHYANNKSDGKVILKPNADEGR